jgi:secondary thiamine-phosphate synthase enzyme
MKIYQETLNLKSIRRTQLINCTSSIQGIISQSGVKDGLALLYCGHTTGGLIINEDEPNLRQDLESFIERLFPQSGQYLHNQIDSNADSHLKATFLGTSLIIPVSGKNLWLGRWQSIFFVEMDGPRQRSLFITVLGQK